MGAWGTDPWDNDSAADWFGDLWDDVPLVARVQAGLRSGDGAEVVAAVWLCTQLCRTYVWPIADLPATLDQAVGAATRLLDGVDDEGYLDLWGDDSPVRSDLEAMRAELRSRQR